MMRRRQLMAMQSELPSAYRKVEYIEGTGTQYIITDIPVQSPIRIETDLMVTASGGDFAFVCAGYRTNSSVPIVRIGTGHYRSKIQNYYRTYYLLSPPYFDINVRTSDVFYGEEGLQRQWLNGVEASSTNYATETQYLPIDGSKITFYIFAEGRNTNGTKSALFISKARMYGVKIANNAVTLGNFIPCIRKFDNKPGMYDTVTKTFYTNAGTGEFIVPA